MIKPFRLLRAWGVGSWLLILMSAGITMRRRLGFIVRSKNFTRCLSSGLRASPGATAPFIWLRSPSHSEVSSIFLGSQTAPHGRELLLGEGHPDDESQLLPLFFYALACAAARTLSAGAATQRTTTAVACRSTDEAQLGTSLGRAGGAGAFACAAHHTRRAAAAIQKTTTAVAYRSTLCAQLRTSRGRAGLGGQRWGTGQHHECDSSQEQRPHVFLPLETRFFCRLEISIFSPIFRLPPMSHLTRAAISAIVRLRLSLC